MPELPEVESLRRYLIREGMPGSVFERVDVESKPSPEKGTGAISDLTKLPGHKVVRLERRGKQIAAVLDQGVLGLHMGMTGRIEVLDDNEPAPRFTRVEFTLRNGAKDLRMVLADPRRWGAIRTFTDLSEAFAGLGPDALDPDFTAERFAEDVSRRKSPIKPLLLDQSLVAGIGNIYADEALWRSGIHPGTRRLGPERSERLLGHLREVLGEALDNGGTTLRDYRTPDGGSGRNQHHLDCYGRSGQPCRSCGDLLISRSMDQRTTTWCPTCQAR